VRGDDRRGLADEMHETEHAHCVASHGTPAQMSCDNDLAATAGGTRTAANAIRRNDSALPSGRDPGIDVSVISHLGGGSCRSRLFQNTKRLGLADRGALFFK
jgi:hypothetical protein